MRFIRSLSIACLLPVLSVSAVSIASDSVADQELNPALQALTAQQQLLKDVQSFVAEDKAEQQARLQLFLQDKAQQEALLKAAKTRLQRADAEQERLKAQFDRNEEQLIELETLLKQRTGQLGEVFGVVKEQSAELSQQLQASLVGSEFTGRAQSLSFASDKAVPTMAQLQTLWFQLQHEMTHSGTISRFNADVADTDGRIETRPVVRVGTFNAINSKGQFLNWQPERQQLSVLAGQPESNHQQQAAEFFTALSADSKGGVGSSQHLLVDISSGQLLALIGQKPGLSDQIRQGGSVGYIILALGVMGLLTAIYKLVRLNLVRHKITRQLKAEQPSEDNPLGRVLLACQQKLQQIKDKPVTSENLSDSLNSTLDEALLKELPALESGQSMLKLLAAAAPLLGLLGTVTGMIGTFQSITLFGTSDPKLMAGGISQALITTVFGLVVAIPMLFSHGLLSSQSRALLMILQEKSLAQLNQLMIWQPAVEPEDEPVKKQQEKPVSELAAC